MAANNNRPKIHFESVEELLGAPVVKDGSEYVKIKDIYPFKDHPFKVLDDDKMDELVESIKANGVLSPVLIRPREEGGYEMISGHRRLHASEKAGMDSVPAIIKEMTDDEAVIAMVDSNVQREEILPSERAFSFKMKMEALNRQGERTDLTSGTEFQKSEAESTLGTEFQKSEAESTLGTEFQKSEAESTLGTEFQKSEAESTLGTEFQKSEAESTLGTEFQKLDKWSRDVIGTDAGMTGRQVTKYIRLTELIPEILNWVDEKKMSITLAVDISYFDKELQQWIVDYKKENGILLPEQIKELKELKNIDNISKYTFTATMNNALPEKKVNGRVNLSEKKLNRYFPARMTSMERERIILELLEDWKARKDSM